MKRRALMLSILTTALAGCGGGTSAPVTAVPTPPPTKAPAPTPTVPPTTVAPAPPPPVAREWVVTVPTLQPGQSYSIPVPEGARTGGTFGVSDTGTPLPDYIKLTPQGVLSVDLTASSGQTTGVIFFYDEPA